MSIQNTHTERTAILLLLLLHPTAQTTGLKKKQGRGKLKPPVNSPLHVNIVKLSLSVFTSQGRNMISKMFIQTAVLSVVFPHLMSAAFLPKLRTYKHQLRTIDYSSKDDKSSSESHSPFSIQESTEMQQLIVSLSLEPSDQVRRDRLSMLFQKEFSNPDYEISKKFAVLFDQTLIEMGTIIQESAKAQAMTKLKREQDMGETSSTANSSNGTEDYMSLNRSIEERQLWAMVDMMVQSKILATRKIQQLGAENEFQ